MLFADGNTFFISSLDFTKSFLERCTLIGHTVKLQQLLISFLFQRSI